MTVSRYWLKLTVTDHSKNPNDGQIRFWNQGPGSNWAKYQQTLDACFHQINQVLLEASDLGPQMAILDVGCGCGETSLAIARQFGDTVSLLGVDVSKPLLDHAVARTWSEGLDNIQFEQVDVQNDPLPTNTYHRVVSRFGVMFFTDPVAAFSNIRQSVQATGKVVFTAWGPLRDNPWFTIPKEAAESQLGTGEKSDPREPGPLAFSDLEYVHSVLDRAGFSNIDVGHVESVISTDLSLPEVTEVACNLGPAVRLMKEKNGSDSDAYEIRQSVMESFRIYEFAKGIEIPVSLVLCQAD